MRHQVFAYYNTLTIAGKVKPIKCMVATHLTHMIPVFDFDKEQSYYYCVECDYRITPGQQMYDELLERINVADPYPDFPE
jgi:hypothetical protein